MVSHISRSVTSFPAQRHRLVSVKLISMSDFHLQVRTYPTPNIQWSHVFGSGRMALLDELRESPK